MRFAILALRRSGSSHFVNMLGGHPDILCHGNIFSSGMMPVFWPKEDSPPSPQLRALRDELRQLRDSDPRGFLERVYAMGHGKAHVGFKIFPGQNDKMLNRVIKDQSIRKIVLFRENVLACYSSEEAARVSRKWGVQKGGKHPSAPKIRFTEKEFLEYYKEHAAFYSMVLKKLLERRNAFALIRYEEINDSHFLRSVVNFIGADPLKPILESEQRKVQVKQNSSDILSRFSNVDELRLFLANNNLLNWTWEGQTSLAPWERRLAGVADGSSDRPADTGAQRSGSMAA